MSDTSKVATQKCQAHGFLVSAANDAAVALHKRFPGEGTEREGFFADLSSIMATRILDDFDVSGILTITTKIARHSFAKKKSIMLENCFPDEFVFTDAWIPFPDGSALMVAIPTEETAAGLGFLLEFPFSVRAAGLPSLDLKCLDGFLLGSKHCAPMVVAIPASDMKSFVEAKYGNNMFSYKTYVNCSDTPVSRFLLTHLVEDFVEGEAKRSFEADAVKFLDHVMLDVRRGQKRARP